MISIPSSTLDSAMQCPLNQHLGTLVGLFVREGRYWLSSPKSFSEGILATIIPSLNPDINKEREVQVNLTPT